MQLPLKAQSPVISGLIAQGDDASRIVVSLSENPATEARWRIVLEAELSDGTRGKVGVLTSRRPADAHGVGSRILGSATCPGAVRWHATVTQIDTAGAGATALLGAAVAPGPAEEPEVHPNRPFALAVDYQTRTGLAGVEVIEAGRRITAITATVELGAGAAGTVAIPGSETITVPVGTSITVEPGEDLIGPITITFANTTAYVVETVA
jgi:hypothetical protein